MTFEELALELCQTYTDQYADDREQALRDFGMKYRHELIDLETQHGTSVEALVDAAEISPPGYWASMIRQGM